MHVPGFLYIYAIGSHAKVAEVLSYHFTGLKPSFISLTLVFCLYGADNNVAHLCPRCLHHQNALGVLSHDCPSINHYFLAIKSRMDCLAPQCTSLKCFGEWCLYSWFPHTYAHLLPLGPGDRKYIYIYITLLGAWPQHGPLYCVST